MRIGKFNFSVKNIKAFIQANIRMFIEKYGQEFMTLEEHVKEQIVFRESVANPECKAEGACECACSLPDLYYADKTCEKECYPEMMNAKDWADFKHTLESYNIKQEYPLPKIWKTDSISLKHLNVVSTGDIDLGEVFKGEIREVPIEYINKSKSVVKLSGVRTSCGCTLSKTLELELNPGESGSLIFTFDSSKRKIGTSLVYTTAVWSDGSETTVGIGAQVVDKAIPDVPKYVVYIDAGHGGVDANGRYTTRGKSFKHSKGQFHDGTMFYEGVSNRLSADILKPMLEAEGFEVVVIYEPVADISLTERVNRANSHWRNGKRPGLLISLHSNAVSAERAGQARGFLVYTSIGETPSDVIAHDLLDEYEKMFPNLRVRRDSRNSGPDYEANFTMLSKTVMPAILPENLFFDNYDDAVLLMSEDYHKNYCQALVNTCIKARNRFYNIA